MHGFYMCAGPNAKGNKGIHWDVPNRRGCTYNCGMAQIKELTFEVDGLKLSGALHMSDAANPACVIISHGFAGYGDSPKWNFLARGLAHAGFAALRFSHRGCGDSQGDFADTTLTGRVRDLRAAMNTAVQHTGARAVALLGSSFGGVTALLCADDPRVRCALVMGAPSDFDFFADIFPHSDPARDSLLELDGMRVKSGIIVDVKNYDILDAASRAPGLCVIHGRNDELLPVRHAERIFSAAPEPKELHILPGADHPFSNETDQQTILDTAVRWFQMYLKD